VLNESFVRNAERVLVAGGLLHYWTDVRERFDETLELLAVKTSLVGPFEVAERAAEHDLDYRTHFERRMRLADLPVYRSAFRKQ
jgi:tRNA (guanine-N7-)-methyltransferase